MTKDPVTVSPEMDIHEAAKFIGSQGYRRIPVLDGGKPIGIRSVADIAEHAKTCNLCMQNVFKELAKAER
jgi:predicted transcriptional regulator